MPAGAKRFQIGSNATCWRLAFGGAPALLVPDNAKVAVIKACHFDSTGQSHLYRDGGSLRQRRFADSTPPSA